MIQPVFKTRYNTIELAEFKTLINQKISLAQKDLKALKDSLQSHIESSGNRSEWDIETSAQEGERELLNRLIQRQYHFIRDLQYALIRIENKTYGICRKTGQLISKERLLQVPHTTLSIHAKQILNKKSA